MIVQSKAASTESQNYNEFDDLLHEIWQCTWEQKVVHSNIKQLFTSEWDYTRHSTGQACEGLSKMTKTAQCRTEPQQNASSVLNAQRNNIEKIQNFSRDSTKMKLFRKKIYYIYLRFGEKQFNVF